MGSEGRERVGLRSRRRDRGRVCGEASDPAGRVRIEGLAEDPAGVLAVEVRRDRKLLARVLPEATDGAPVTTYEFKLDFEPPPGAGGLELRVLGASGLESRVARLRVR